MPMTSCPSPVQRVAFDKDSRMRIKKGPVGGLVVSGTAEEWARCNAGLEDLYRALQHDVLPAAANPTAGGVVVTLTEALTMMAVMGDEDLTRSLMTRILADRLPITETPRRRRLAIAGCRAVRWRWRGPGEPAACRERYAGLTAR